LFKLRKAQVEAGVDVGFVSEAKSIMSLVGLGGLWGATAFPAAGLWKKLCKAAVAHLEITEWQAWSTSYSSSLISCAKREWGQEPYVSDLDCGARALRAAFRLEATSARGCVTSKSHLFCRLCGLDFVETERHLALECFALSDARMALWQSAGIQPPADPKVAWATFTAFSDGSQRFMENIAEFFRWSTGSSLSPGGQAVNPADEQYAESLLETATWVLKGARKP
jgi:hypothetical protein